MTICIGCGCDEEHACITKGGRCAWRAVSSGMIAGLCTACADLIPPSQLAADLEDAEASMLHGERASELILPGDPDFAL